jgi:hypothetical protein
MELQKFRFQFTPHRYVFLNFIVNLLTYHIYWYWVSSFGVVVKIRNRAGLERKQKRILSTQAKKIIIPFFKGKSLLLSFCEVKQGQTRGEEGKEASWKEEMNRRKRMKRGRRRGDDKGKGRGMSVGKGEEKEGNRGAREEMEEEEKGGIGIGGAGRRRGIGGKGGRRGREDRWGWRKREGKECGKKGRRRKEIEVRERRWNRRRREEYG